jgi:hypothetical protein
MTTAAEKLIFVPQPTNTSKWSPVVGDFTQQYLADLENFDQAAKSKLLQESSEILADATPPSTTSYSEAGLIVGYVQSGKTQSFTTIAALARDNGYGMVIVLTGITNLLKTQSIERLVDDLGLKAYMTEWRLFENPGSSSIADSSAQSAEIKRRVEAWTRSQEQNAPNKKPSLLVTVLKSKTRIQNLANLLSTIKEMVRVPTLIIDDESDQASPNLKSAKNLARGEDEQSSTYGAIVNLRRFLTRHTYLQYTATPQANLLSAKSDILSPSFARVISPGAGYTGGEFFFQEPSNPNITIIPDSDTIDPKSLPDEPPESLLSSLRSFWLGAAISVVENHQNGKMPATRSMMIQVSAQISPQALFRKWTQHVQGQWSKLLDDDSKASYKELVGEFRETYTELKATYPGIPSFEECLGELRDAIEDTRVVEVNSDKDAEKKVEWYHSRFWILVGGMKLDRGFTVKGITTTYMPRTVAENADTLQQRARFFGYHGKYAGLCRIFISQSTFQSYANYLEHETELRASLKKHQGLPLREWKRQFILDRALKPTRSNVIGMKVRRNTVNQGWLTPAFMHANHEAITHNQEIFETFINEKVIPSGVSLYPEGWKDLRKSKKHILYSGVSVSDVIDFIASTALPDKDDSAKIMATAIALSRARNSSKITHIDVVLMNGYSSDGLDGRNADPDKGIENIFIGRNPAGVTSVEQLNYIGDREIHTSNLTLQLRLVRERQTLNDLGQMIDIPWLSLKVSPEVTISILEEIED